MKGHLKVIKLGNHWKYHQDETNTSSEARARSDIVLAQDSELQPTAVGVGALNGEFSQRGAMVHGIPVSKDKVKN